MNTYLVSILLFVGDYAPVGFELCLGQELQINRYQALYALIGNTYGGDQQKGTFKLPKLEGPEDPDAKVKPLYMICLAGAWPQRQ